MRAFVAVQADEVCGFAALVIGLDCVQILELIVSRKHRRTGIGATLLRQMFDLRDSLRLPLAAIVRGTDCEGMTWLCRRGFEVARRENGSVAIEPDAFPLDDCDGITLVCTRASQERAIAVRIVG